MASFRKLSRSKITESRKKGERGRIFTPSARRPRVFIKIMSTAETKSKPPVPLEPIWEKIRALRSQCSWVNLYYGVISNLITKHNYQTCVEIGVAYGYHADEILTNTNVQYVGVDPYVADYDPNDRFVQDVQQMIGLSAQQSMDILHDYVAAKLFTYTGSNGAARGSIFRESSELSSARYMPKSVDLVFVDGDHRYAHVLADLTSWWPKISEGGIMCGHNYWMGDVAKACTEFSKVSGVPLQMIRKPGTSYDIYCFSKYIATPVSQSAPTSDSKSYSTVNAKKTELASFPTFSLPNHKGVPIDHLLVEHFQFLENGVFIEAGANDGVTQSNTKLLQERYGWKGLLVEPSPAAFAQIANNRPHAIKENCALVSNDYKGNTLTGDFDGHLMSSVGGLRRSNSNQVTVPVQTLTSLLERHKLTDVDFLSLDAEGYELSILKGLDFTRFAPKWMLVEIYNVSFDELVAFLRERDYDLICNLSNYNKTDNPIWDGTHNDFLFKLSASSAAQNSSPASATKNSTPSSEAQNASPASEAQNGSPASEAQNGSPASEAQNGSPASEAQNGSPAAEAKNGSPSSASQNLSPSSAAQNSSPPSAAQNSPPLSPWRSPCSMVYPPYKSGRLVEEYFSDYYRKHRSEFPADMVYIDVWWTNIYCNALFCHIPYDQTALQAYLDGLSAKTNAQFFTVVQIDDGIKERLPPGTIVYASGGIGNVPLPLIYEDDQNRVIEAKRLAKRTDYQSKPLLCSFVGRRTHPVRQKIFDLFDAKTSGFVIGDGCDMSIFIDTTVKSKFALAPRGYGRSSFRFVEIMQLGTVPIYVHDGHLWSPFEDEIDSQKFSLTVHQDKLAELPQMLAAIDETRYQNMLSEAAAEAHRFTLLGSATYIARHLSRLSTKSDPSRTCFSLVIPTYKRFEYLKESVPKYLATSCVDEVVIVDDDSGDCEKLRDLIPQNIKLRLYRNRKNLGASRNKMVAVKQARNEYVLLWDSDNEIADETLHLLSKTRDFNANNILCAGWARPNFNYNAILPELVMDSTHMSKGRDYEWFFNTGNYIVPKTAYLMAAAQVMASKIDPGPYDVFYINYFMARNGCKFVKCSEFQYEHRLHNDSLWHQTHSQYDGWYGGFSKTCDTAGAGPSSESTLGLDLEDPLRIA
jgi:FkbM family methyltransferase